MTSMSSDARIVDGDQTPNELRILAARDQKRRKSRKVSGRGKIRG